MQFNYRSLVFASALLVGLTAAIPDADARTRVRGKVVQEWQCHRQYGCRWVTIGRVKKPRPRYVRVCDRYGCRMVRTSTPRRY